MKKLILAALVATISVAANAQINIKAKGEDVRSVIASIFEQAKEQYVLEASVRQTLYMSLDNITFDKATSLISEVADLTFEKKDGIWHITTRKKAMKPKMIPQAEEPKISTPKPTISSSKPEVKSEMPKRQTAAQTFQPMVVKKTLPPATTPSTSMRSIDLTKRLTTRMQKAELKDVFAEFTRQTGVQIEMDDSVPNYKIDAFMFNTSLKFAIERICKAANLKFILTPGNTVRVSKA